MADSWNAFYWSDYLRKTAGLSMVQHGAYLLLLAEYYSCGKLSANADFLFRVCRALADDEKAAVLSVVERFFYLDPEDANFYRNRRADDEISKRLIVKDKRAKAGQKGQQTWQQNRRQNNGKPSANASARPYTTTTTTTNTKTTPCAKPEFPKEAEQIVLSIGRLHPANAHRSEALGSLPTDQERAICEAINRHGDEAVIAGTRNYAAAVDKWPIEGRARRVKGVVKFYSDSDYMRDPREWQDEPAKNEKPKVSGSGYVLWTPELQRKKEEEDEAWQLKQDEVRKQERIKREQLALKRQGAGV